MIQLTTEQLLKDITEFCEKKDMTLSDFGANCLNDRSFVTRLRDGRMPRIDTVNKVYSFMN